MTQTPFPEGFLWGASTAGHQVEGANLNADIWPLEWAPHSIFTEPSRDACDHYHRYAEDMALLAGVGCNSYRFSIEWARVEPEPGYFSLAALDHYRDMVTTCRDLGLEPVVTYNHFTTPRWFAAAGGWGQPDAAALFTRYVAEVTEHLGDALSWVVTLNEPNLMALLETSGVFPAGASDLALASLTGARGLATGGGIDGDFGDADRYRIGMQAGDVATMTAVHRSAVDAIKAINPDIKVGWSLALVDLYPAEGGEQRCGDGRQRAEIDWLEVSRDDDFIGVQTYSREFIGPNGTVPAAEGTPTMQTGWEVFPAALGNTVRLAAKHAGVAVLVTENGMATSDDDARIAYTHEALRSLAACIDDGIDVRGYLHWSLLDNYEWMHGYAMTFGLIEVDRTTFERTVKNSARWLGRVAQTNSLPA